MEIKCKPIGFVRGGRTEFGHDDWDGNTAHIDLDTNWFSSDALMELSQFSHIEVIFYFHQTDPNTIVTTARHPRDNKEWPLTGIFAQRVQLRPNRLGITTCRVLNVEGTRIEVQGLDAINGTPVLDIKPYMARFAPRGEVREPDWTDELMAGYW